MTIAPSLQVSAGSSDSANALMTVECRAMGVDDASIITLFRQTASSFQDEQVATVKIKIPEFVVETSWGPSSIGSRSPQSTLEGDITDPNNSYLRVGVHQLSCADGGMYKCVVAYSVGGVSGSDSTNQNVTVTCKSMTH
jgi:hypothetical protein